MPQPQNYRNHRKYVPLYHFVLSPISTLLLIASAAYLLVKPITVASILIAGCAACIFILVMLVRQFATRLQDRSIYHEESLRHLRLTGQPLDPRLSLRQIIALRFAEDADFPRLCVDAAKAGTAPDEIKKSIRHWRADHIRV